MTPPSRTARASSPGRQNLLGQAIRARGAETRRRLLEATEELLDTTPLRDLRIAHIVRRAKTSPATFYVYFSDVSDVVLELIERATQSPPKLLSIVSQPWPREQAYERANEFLTAYLETWGAHAALFRIRNLASDEGDLRFSAARIQAVEPLLTRIAASIEAQRPQGHLPPEFDGMSVAGALLAFMERVAALTRLTPDGPVKTNFLNVAAFFLVLLMRPDAVAAAAPAARTARPVLPTPAVLRESANASLSAVLSKGGRNGGGAELNLHGQAMGAKGERTRARLLAAAEELLGHATLRELTVADITKSAQTSASTFYLYFQDVTEAVLALACSKSPCTPELLELARRTLEQPGSGGAWALVNAYMTEWRKDAAVYRVRNLAADHGDERFVAARSEAVRPLLEIIAEAIAAHQARGGLLPNIDPVAAAAASLGTLERLAVTPNIRGQGGATRESMGRVAAFMLDVLTGGVVTAPA